MTTYEQQGTGDKFYLELKNEVETYFKQNNVGATLELAYFVCV